MKAIGAEHALRNREEMVPFSHSHASSIRYVLPIAQNLTTEQKASMPK
jgi:hypothetical protein